jgi:hypothetical protein
MSHVTSSIEHLLETFTTSQLRELDFSLAPNIDSATRSKNHKNFIQAIVKRYEGKKLAVHALRLETLQPYKHVFLFTFKAPEERFDLEWLYEKVDTGFPGLFNEPKLVEPSIDELKPEVCVVDRERKRILVKFVHLVETWQSEWSTPTRKEWKPVKRRHPVVVSLFPEDKLMTVSFPGYTQGATPPTIQRTTYSDIARNVCSAFGSGTKIGAAAFPIRQTIELLLQKEPDVKAVRRYVKAAEGKMMLDSSDGIGSSEEFLAAKFWKEARTEIPQEAIRAVFNSMEAVDILLHWRKKELFTRIGFHDFAPELLFIWKSTAAEASRIDDVLAVIVEYRKYAETGKLSEAVNFVDRATPGTVIRPTQVGQQFSLSLDETLKILYRAMERGVVDILFRVKTNEVLMDFDNDWRKNLSEFPAEVTDEHGQSINLSEHKNIEVAFRRLSA